jgi:hypothetical protein
MLTKTTMLALASALSLSMAAAALAANENEQKGGYREEGPGGNVSEGVNPAYHESMHRPGGDAAACEHNFKTYDAATGTFMGEDGKRHPC